jgi:hypothetical protein
MGEVSCFTTEINTENLIPVKIESVAHALSIVLEKEPFVVCWSDFSDRFIPSDFEPMCYVLATKEIRSIEILSAECYNTQGLAGTVNYKGWKDNLLNEKREDEKDEEETGGRRCR